MEFPAQLPFIGSFSQGQPLNLVLRYYNAAGVLTDPSSPSLTLQNRGTGSALHYVEGDMTRTGTGIYTITIAIGEAGTWVAGVFDDVALGARNPYELKITEDPSYGH